MCSYEIKIFGYNFFYESDNINALSDHLETIVFLQRKIIQNEE